MGGEDALAAAKAAALRDLTQLHGTRTARRPRRRPRRRAHAARSTPAVEAEEANGVHTQLTPAADYVPEPVESVVSALAKSGGAGADAAVSPEALSEIASVLKRFAERGGGGDGTRDAPEDTAGAAKAVEAEASGGVDGAGADGAKRGEAETEKGGDGEPGDGEKAGGEKEPLISRKQRKELQRNLISRLKSLSEAPDVVESWDITGPDPLLLVHLKAWPNSVGVPANWRQKRKYLQNKRGMEKRAFQLPAYIVDTGVGELRDAQLEADEKKSLKQRQREKMRAKTGRGVEIDHSRLHDAFFKFQVKPRLTGHGDVYYELRELEVDHSQFRAGVMSEELRAALGVGERDPPPWLVNMQRYGPPPGYPGLKVAGLNAGIPGGAAFGFQAGGWGKPPVDERGRPIYGDVFGEGLEFGSRDERYGLGEDEKARLWGEVERVEDGLRVQVGEEEEESEGEEGEKRTVEAVREKGVGAGGETARKGVEAGNAVDEGEVSKGVGSGELYTVLEERRVSVGAGAMMGSSHVYAVGREAAGVSGGAGGEKRRREEEAEEGGDGGVTTKKQKEFKF